MNSFEPRGVEEARPISEDHSPIAGTGGNRPPSAIRHRLRPVANHLAAFEQLRDKRMALEFLQYVLRIEPRVGIVEPRHKAEGDHTILRAVDPGAAVLF